MPRFLLSSLLFLLIQFQSYAQLYIKNDAPYTVWVAVGYYIPSSKEWYSKGWYKLDDNAVTNIFDYDLSYNRYYYYYAYDNDGNYWAGSSDCSTCATFYISTDKFTLDKAAEYTDSQYSKKKFRRIDAGGSSSYTINLSGEDWSDGDCQNGYGTYKWVAASKKYKGYWKGGVRTGQGTCEYGKYHSKYANCKFEGEWQNDAWYNGTFSWPDGSSFTGKFRDELKNGYGTLNWAEGSKYEGYWENDKRNGQGTLYYLDKTYKGNWLDDKRSGQGTCNYGSNHSSFPNCKFDGTWENNFWKYGTLYYADGSKYVGNFSGTNRHGKGKLYSSSGELQKSGEWENDKLIISDDSKPTITWDQPATKDIAVASSSYEIKACIHAPSGLKSVKVYLNNALYKDRGFTVEENCTQTVNIRIPLLNGINKVYITANNSAGECISETRTIRYNATNGSDPANNYFGLFVGVEEYSDLAIVDLENPIDDAVRLKDVLVSGYNFPAGNTFLMKNPKKEDLVNKIQELQARLGEHDYLLIFFAGHGKMQGSEGYWLCSDAKTGNAYNWMSSSELNGYLKNFKSNHILLISDACYGGAFVMRDVDDISEEDEKRACEILEKQKSRCAMTSGAKTTVPDKSTFIDYLVKRLRDNSQGCISAEELYLSFKTAVVSNSPNGQIPQYGLIPQTGHEGGGFIFYKK